MTPEQETANRDTLELTITMIRQSGVGAHSAEDVSAVFRHLYAEIIDVLTLGVGSTDDRASQEGAERAAQPK